jgi:23S rRNA (adenine2503-C2)-methyltransferase
LRYKLWLMKNIVGCTLKELEHIAAEQGLPKFTAKEMGKWIYQKGARSFDEMTNLSKVAREQLKQNYTIVLSVPDDVKESADGTKKYLYHAINGKYIETAYIPDAKRTTLCVSSQVGCKMGCRFCMTARQGLQGQLSAADILNQILSLPEREKITNIVFMGMGEPFDNTDEVLRALEILTADYGFGLSPRRINVSTIGLVPGMKRFINESKCHLAISMHSPFDEERKRLMPVQRLYPIEEVVQLLRDSDFERQRRISFEYILFKGINDTVQHVNQLARLLNGLRCRLNIMHYHAIPGSGLEGANQETLIWFRDKLNKKGIIATVRKSRGEDIMAACGLLSTGKIQQESS